MRRTIPILSGLAILAVVLNHSNWHVLRDFPPGDLMPSLPYLLIDQLTKFAVPAFVFITGYFIAYATSEGKNPLKWEVVQARVLGLTWPWLIWSCVLVIYQTFKDSPFTFELFLRTMFIQYYFVPLLMFYYLAAMLIIRLAQQNLKRLLLGAGLVQLAMIGVFYLCLYWDGFPDEMNPWVQIGVLQYLRFAIYFPLGVVAGMYGAKARAWLAPYRRWLPGLVVITYALQVIEASYAFRLGPDYFPIGADQTRLTSALYSLSILLVFVANARVQLPFARQITFLGANTFGLYLSHYAFLGGFAFLVRTYLPWVAGRGWLLLPVLYVLALGAAVVFMEILKRFPLRRVYRTVLG